MMGGLWVTTKDEAAAKLFLADADMQADLHRQNVRYWSQRWDAAWRGAREFFRSRW